MTARLSQDDAANRLDGAPAQRSRKTVLILKAAHRLFLEQGFDAITMDMVAQKAPVSKATLYAYFASKEDLFTAVVVDEANRISDEIWRIVPDDGDIDGALRHVAENFVGIFLSKDTMSLLRAVIAVVPRFPSVGAAIFETGALPMRERLAKFLTGAHERGLLNVPDPMLAAGQFLSLVKGDLDIRHQLLPTRPPDRREIEAQIKAGVGLFLHFYARRKNEAWDALR